VARGAVRAATNPLLACISHPIRPLLALAAQ
jgi:hypothetical protein